LCPGSGKPYKRFRTYSVSRTVPVPLNPDELIEFR